MPSDPISPRVLADFAADAVMYGLLPAARVVAWADAMVAASDVPPAWVVELALVDASDVLAVRTALRGVPGEADGRVSLCLLSAMVLREWRAGRLSIGEVRGVGWQVSDGEFWMYELKGWAASVDYEGDAMEAGFITQPEMCQFIDRELEPFEPYLGELPWWSDLGASTRPASGAAKRAGGIGTLTPAAAR